MKSYQDQKSLIAQARTVYTMSSAHRAGWGDGLCAEYAKHGVEFLLDKMWDERGFFYFRKGRFMTNKIPYMRWSQAWGFHALTTYAANRQISRGCGENLD